jgi:uncharacterized protein
MTPCPICGKPSRPERRPFCSARCAEIDLGRWFAGAYRVPGPPPELDEEAPPATDPEGA